MAKFIKSIFQTTDKRKDSCEGENEEERSDNPPMDGRRQLFISRSGRMRQANKKRHSLALELYGDTIDIDVAERPTSMEYHVHGPLSQTPSPALGSDNRLDGNSDVKVTPDETSIANTIEISLEKKLTGLALASGAKSPEEEIDNAFEIIDKT